MKGVTRSYSIVVLTNGTFRESSYYQTMIYSVLCIFIVVLAAESKIYDRCELARELYEKHRFPLDDIPKWLCLVHWESGFNTKAVNKGQTPNSLDHGIFQISDSRWCKSPLRPSENRCAMACENLTDDDLSDDAQCLRTIAAQKRLHEWMSYGLRCNANTQEYFKGCDITSRTLNVGMKLNAEPVPFVRFNVKHVKDRPNFMKIRLGLTKDPIGVRANVNVKETKLNFFSKYLGGYYRMKPFFTMHQYVTK